MVAFEIFGLKIYWYGILYLFSFLIGYIFFLVIRNTKLISNYPKIQNFLKTQLDDLILVIFLGVILGGRLGYVIIYDLNFFISKPLEILFIWKGGMSFVGGVIGVASIVFLYFKKLKFEKKDYLLMMDIIVSILPIGIILGRLGNFLNQELYGKAITDFLPNISNETIIQLAKFKILYIYKNIDYTYRINSNLLEGFFEGFILLFIVQIIFWISIKKQSIRPGLISGIFMILYGIIRFFAEFLRYSPNDGYIAYFTKSQALMIIFFFVGIYLIKYKKI